MYVIETPSLGMKKFQDQERTGNNICMNFKLNIF